MTSSILKPNAPWGFARPTCLASVALACCALFSSLVVFAQVAVDPRAPSDKQPARLADSAPDRYTVVRGDTLWAIAGKFLKDPWRWPDVWRLNQSQIANPHLIYPGDLIVLDRNAAGGPQLRLVRGSEEPGSASVNDQRPVVRLSPQMRSEARAASGAIPSIPPSEIEPFLYRPMVIEANELENSPRIIDGRDARVVFSPGDTAYVLGIEEVKGRNWQIYRPVGAIRDPYRPPPSAFQRWWNSSIADPGLLGHEAQYLGEAKVLQFGDVARVEILSNKEEIVRGDRLLPPPPYSEVQYAPRAPAIKVDAPVVRLSGPLAEVGRGGVFLLAAGKREGIEVGHVVSVHQIGREIPNPKYRPTAPLPLPFLSEKPEHPPTIKIPDERAGLAFVFRVFEGVSYALVMNTSMPIRVGDRVRNP